MNRRHPIIFWLAEPVALAGSALMIVGVAEDAPVEVIREYLPNYRRAGR